MASPILLKTQMEQTISTWHEIWTLLESLIGTPNAVPNGLKDNFLDATETILTLAVAYQDYDFDYAKLRAQLVAGSFRESWAASLFKDRGQRSKRMLDACRLAEKFLKGREESEVEARLDAFKMVLKNFEQSPALVAFMEQAGKERDKADGTVMAGGIENRTEDIKKRRSKETKSGDA
ncbi:hypothetical protein DOTSEDRAFT_36603 [Dothistroma septosporum NZE10]|uniref:Uncharacterized protein n=1 Tax=Dothistroma septosporum (strain NZE10 / CBS 128990) TaxID=675120 RepID=N1PGB1_DOTSN|nr:hypothetical protein DOTSEDRAFT_36603 [Dothistroma septosporum NZE10]